MHIIYLQQLLVLPSGSGNPRSFEQACEWVRMGNKVSIICTDACFPPSEKKSSKKGSYMFQKRGIDIHVIPVAYSHMMPFKRRVLSFLLFFFKAWFLRKRLKRPDIILAYSAPLSVGELGYRLSKFFSCPWVFEVADVWPDVPIGMGVIRHKLLQKVLLSRSKFLYQDARKILPFTPGMAQQILAHGIDEQKLEVIHNGVSMDTNPNNDASAKDEIYINVIYTGTIGIANGLDQIIELARLCELKGNHIIHFHIIGNGNDKERVLQLANSYKLQNISFHGRIPKKDLNIILSKANIGIISFAPFKVLEANGATKLYDYLAAGLPILINYRGWQAELLETNRCGFASDQADLQQLYTNLMTLAESNTLREEMGNRGKVLAQEFSREKTARQTYNVMEEIVRESELALDANMLPKPEAIGTTNR